MVASKMFNPFISRAVIVWPRCGAERGPPCGASLRLLILQTYWVLLPAQDVSSSAFLLFGQSVRLFRLSPAVGEALARAAVTQVVAGRAVPAADAQD